MNKGESVQFLEMFQNMPHFLPSLIEKMAKKSHFLLHIEFGQKWPKMVIFIEIIQKLRLKMSSKRSFLNRMGPGPFPKKLCFLGPLLARYFGVGSCFDDDRLVHKTENLK